MVFEARGAGGLGRLDFPLVVSFRILEQPLEGLVMRYGDRPVLVECVSRTPNSPTVALGSERPSAVSSRSRRSISRAETKGGLLVGVVKAYYEPQSVCHLLPRALIQIAGVHLATR